MTILTRTPPHARPSQLLLRTTSRANQIQVQVPWVLSPALTHSLYLATLLKDLLSHLSFCIFLWCRWLSTVLLQQARNIPPLLQSAAKVFSRIWRQVCVEGWKKTEWVRNKLFFEFMVFVLGGGNGLFLVLFWPGWIVLSAGVLTVWAVCG